ncbi:hypothetical protein B0H63DRAFT_452895 [Podospora didyma]|uniref:Uncharacterized protein n=1 Tax=Podospora didyma TaxID=330526 RepID=A0AAE0KEL1_9PEZI|nr:hypothetical protein B0H63DRAFT_452895 [Podospora didyma]
MSSTQQQQDRNNMEDEEGWGTTGGGGGGRKTPDTDWGSRPATPPNVVGVFEMSPLKREFDKHYWHSHSHSEETETTTTTATATTTTKKSTTTAKKNHRTDSQSSTEDFYHDNHHHHRNYRRRRGVTDSDASATPTAEKWLKDATSRGRAISSAHRRPEIDTRLPTDLVLNPIGFRDIPEKTPEQIQRERDQSYAGDAQSIATEFQRINSRFKLTLPMDQNKNQGTPTSKDPTRG